MRISFDDLYSKALYAGFWVYVVCCLLSPLLIVWVFIIDPILPEPKFAPRTPLATPGGKTTPQDPEAPLQTPCKTQIDPKN